MPAVEEADASIVREEVFFPSVWMPIVRQSPLITWGRKLDHSTPFGKMDVKHYLQEHFFFVFMSFNTGGIFVTNVKKFSEDRHWNFITMSYRTTCWLKIRILEAVPVLSVDPNHNNSSEVAVGSLQTIGIPKLRLLLPFVNTRRVSVHALHTICGV